MTDVVDNCRTARAVGELVAVAFRECGGKGSPGAVVLRHKRGRIMIRRQSIEKMREQRDVRLALLTKVLQSEHSNAASVADMLGKEICDLRTEIAAARMQRQRANDKKH